VVSAGEQHDSDVPTLGVGQVVIRPAESVKSTQARDIYQLSDPLLSELGLDELLDELLLRVRAALEVDTVAILLVDGGTRELVARAAKGIEEEVEQGVRIPIGRGFAGRIAAERVPIFIEDVDHADILNPILREKGIRSLLGIPLIVEGTLIGVLHVGSLHPREFVSSDVAVLQMAALRAAPAIERAQVYAALEHEHRVAVVLQRSLLPRRLPAVVGISVAARYLPARDEVGGDWFDVIELPRGRLGIAIGDVVGHGTRAAALMGQLRTALHAYALESNGPGRALDLVDRFMESIGGGMATAAYGVFDPQTGGLTLATAGHLPPIVASEAGARVLDIVPAPPLGAFPYGSYAETELSLESGSTIVLYTDGLVERPGVSVSDGIEKLADIVRRAGSVEDACVLAMDRLVPPGGARDDVAILALRNLPVPATLDLRLPADPGVLSSMRHTLRRWLVARGATRTDLTEITMAVSEACANAIEHAYSPGPNEFHLHGSGGDGSVTLIVRDTGRWREPRGYDRGRGLGIMDAAMDKVDIDRSAAGTVITMRRRLGSV
jgi:anti-sigma regulatory factor (Ser/Thr protein kinase)/putative methionine-R-sulfoxide reductase with GAF domain